MTPSGIEPATFRFVAQRLNYCATAMPSWDTEYIYYREKVENIFVSDLPVSKISSFL